MAACSTTPGKPGTSVGRAHSDDTPRTLHKARDASLLCRQPPFVGKKEKNAEQKADLASVKRYIKGAGVLDYVSGWYLKAAQYLAGSKEGFASPHKREFRDARLGGA
ncbi:MAG TPA: DNA methyltransferase, partial [Immundisolibacter sp.]